MKKEDPAEKRKAGAERGKKAAERKLARPPKDKREVTIGPTTSTGPDITLG